METYCREKITGDVMADLVQCSNWFFSNVTVSDSRVASQTLEEVVFVRLSKISESDTKQIRKVPRYQFSPRLQLDSLPRQDSRSQRVIEQTFKLKTYHFDVLYYSYKVQNTKLMRPLQKKTQPNYWMWGCFPHTAGCQFEPWITGTAANVYLAW